jgi:hypothetical protein
VRTSRGGPFLTCPVVFQDKSDRMMLDQYKALVQPTQFLEHMRKTMPMLEPQLDMVLSMHECMFRRLKALEMLHKGGQSAVDEFMSSGLQGLEKRKENALHKAKRAEPQGGGGGGGGGNAARQRARRSGGGQAFKEPGAVSHTDVGSGLQRAQAAAAATGREMWKM